MDDFAFELEQDEAGPSSPRCKVCYERAKSRLGPRTQSGPPSAYSSLTFLRCEGRSSVCADLACPEPCINASISLPLASYQSDLRAESKTTSPRRIVIVMLERSMSRADSFVMSRSSTAKSAD